MHKSILFLTFALNNQNNRTMGMSKIIVKAFFYDLIEASRKVICVFDKDVTEDEMKDIIMEHLRENEYDDIDDMAPLHTAEEIEETAENIINGGVFDCDMAKYFIDDVEMYYKN